MILVGIDDSADAAAALRWAYDVAGHTDEHLVVVRAWAYGRLSAIAPPDPLPGVERMDEQVHDEARAFVVQTLGADVELGGERDGAAVEAGTDRSRPRVRVETRRGVARHALAAAVDELAPGMVVLGHRGLGRIGSVLLGSVGHHLLQRARCPVVLVRDLDGRPTMAPAPTIVVGVDGSEPSNDALRWAATLCERLDGELVVAHAALPDAGLAVGVLPAAGPEEHPVLDAASTHLSRSGVRHRLVLVWGDPRTSLEDVATDAGADLVVVASRGHGAVRRMVLGSVATYVAQHVEGPVAVVPPAGRVPDPPGQS